jgi:DNA-binding transcriptional MocR family regulator
MTPAPFACIPRHVFADARIRGSLHVLGVLASYANAAGEMWPSLRAVAGDLALTRSGVRYHLEQLVAAGALVQVTGGPGRRAARYRLAWVIHKSAVTPRSERGDTAMRARSHRDESAVKGAPPLAVSSQNGAHQTNRTTGIGTTGTQGGAPIDTVRALVDAAIAETKPRRPRATVFEREAALAAQQADERGQGDDADLDD